MGFLKTILGGTTHIWGGLNDGSVVELAKKSDIPSIPSVPSVINNLTSSSTTDALSANQGRILLNKINALPTSPVLVAAGSIGTGQTKTIPACSYLTITVSSTSSNMTISPTKFNVAKGGTSGCSVQYQDRIKSLSVTLNSSGTSISVSSMSYDVDITYSAYKQ